MRLAACPFCGTYAAKNELFGSKIVSKACHWVECESCGATGPERKTRDEAEEAWNERAEG